MLLSEVALPNCSNCPCLGASSLTSFINQSPLNEGKKQLAIRQAGDYDAAAIRAQISTLVNDNGVSNMPLAGVVLGGGSVSFNTTYHSCSCAPCCTGAGVQLDQVSCLLVTFDCRPSCA